MGDDDDEDEAFDNEASAKLAKPMPVSEIISSLPKGHRRDANLLLNHLVATNRIKWDNAGVVKIDNNVINDSSIADLLRSVLKKSANAFLEPSSPAGQLEITRLLKETEAPLKLIKNPFMAQKSLTPAYSCRGAARWVEVVEARLIIMELEKQYYDPSHEAGFAGARRLLKVNAKNQPLDEKSREKILRWLDAQDAYTLHRLARRKFPRLRYDVTNIDDVWECDLMQLTTIKKDNDGYCYLLVVVDVLSKYAWIESLRDKSVATVLQAFKKILPDKRSPQLLQSDKGSEFRFVRNPDVKAAVVERLNRTLRERIWRYLTYSNSKRFIDVIRDIVAAYNDSVHSSTKMRPSDVTPDDVPFIRENLLKRSRQQTANRKKPRKKAKYNVGTHVRISRYKATFEKGYASNFTEEIFRIKRVSLRQEIYTYVLEDLNGEEIAPVSDERLTDDRFKIEKVIRTRGKGERKEAYVKWSGYPDSFNQWIKYSELESI
uniref:Chromo domain-containing protein n=1 Tax=Trichogramma kaykai TaxID=54128 RepID=A0ABD2W6T9_9HYME